jgi:hypothetical protein
MDELLYPGRWLAPWTPEQTAALTRRQASYTHAYRCEHGHILQPVPNGLACQPCRWMRYWAYAEPVRTPNG